MKFAHVSDTHLGYRQFGLYEREEDFYEVFNKIIDKIIEEKVDFVIHSGDLFETARPSPNTLLIFQKALIKLKNAGITMYAIAGNHDTILRNNAIPPQAIFKKLGLKLISPKNTEYIHKGIHITGLPFFPKSQIKHFKNKLNQITEKAKSYDKSILVLHQGIDKYLPFQYELEIGDIPDNFNYYALGHIHNYVNEEFGKGYLVYPGSTEISKTNEIIDYNKNGKGFLIVDLDGDKPDIERIVIDSPRKFIQKTCDFKDLFTIISQIKKEIKGSKNKPILNINVNNIDENTGKIHELIYSQLDKYCLSIKTQFNYKEPDSSSSIHESSLSIEELIKESLKKYNNKDMTNLAIDIYNYLSKDNDNAVHDLIKKYYDDHYIN